MNPMMTADAEDITIASLKKAGTTLLVVLDLESEKACMRPTADLISSINTNIRTLAAINEVLLYFGDEGLFAEGL